MSAQKWSKTFAVLGFCVVTGMLPTVSHGQGTSPPFTGVTQSWDKVLPAAQRFDVLPAFNNEAVRDNETGLVWERTPDTTPRVFLLAGSHCTQKNVGGRKGWRIPTIEELMSLVEPTASNPALPAGNPFIFTLHTSGLIFWSATVTQYMNIGNFSVRGLGVGLGVMQQLFAEETRPVWCVRAHGPINLN